jgi:hypothetical protein
LVLLSAFFTVLLHVAIEVEDEVESEFLVIFMELLFLPIKLCSVDIKKEVLRFLTYKHLLLERLALDLDAKVKLFVQGVFQCSKPGVEDDACEITDDGFFLLNFFLRVVFDFGPVEELLDDACFGVEDRVIPFQVALVDEGATVGLLFLLPEEVLAEGQSLAETFDDHDVDLRKVFLLAVGQFLPYRIH